jgi:universal stress protein E
MHELKKILVATDFDESSDSIAATALCLARAFDSRILLLHVIPETLSHVLTEEFGAESVTPLLHELKLQIEASGGQVEGAVVLKGKASYNICQYAEQHGANLIVIGASHGSKADARLGVTAARVLRNSARPVWLVAQTKVAPPTSILCPVDMSPASRRGLQNALRLAKQFQARLTVLSVREAMPAVYARMMRPDDLTPLREVKRLRSSLNALLQEYDVRGIEVDAQVREGSPHAEILSAVTELACDLIVMGAEGMSNQPRALVGSVTQKVTRAMPCSILIVNDEDVLATRLNTTIDSIELHMAEAESLLQAGNPLEALAEYERLVLDEPTYAPAWEGMAEAYKSLGDLNKADRCTESAELVRTTIWRT